MDATGMDKRRRRSQLFTNRIGVITVLIVLLLWVHEVASSSSTPSQNGAANKLGSTSETRNNQKSRRASHNTTGSILRDIPINTRQKRHRTKADSNYTTDAAVVQGESVQRRRKKRRNVSLRAESATERQDPNADDEVLALKETREWTKTETSDNGEYSTTFVRHSVVHTVATKPADDPQRNAEEEPELTVDNSTKTCADSIANETKQVYPDQGATSIMSRTETKKAAKTKKSSSSSGTRESAVLRRTKREWRDAVKLGIAYDWRRMETITTRSSKQGSSKKYNYVRIGPWKKNLLQWHFSVQGPANSVYEEGIYHGRILLPKDYPASPPRIHVFTPSGRFKPGHDICLSASNFHPESWTPRWTVLSLVDALRMHMLTTANEIGGVNASSEKRRMLALASREWDIGHVCHKDMVRAGIFPMQGDEEKFTETEYVPQVLEDTTAVLEKEFTNPESTKVKTVLRNEDDPLRGQTQKAAIRKRHPRHGKLIHIILRVVAEILTSPPRLALLAFLTLFFLLNKN